MTPTGKLLFSSDVIFDESTMGKLSSHRKHLSMDSSADEIVTAGKVVAGVEIRKGPCALCRRACVVLLGWVG